jgi:DNA primase
MCCPLHCEKTPSFCIFPDGKFKCFGCGAYGDAADLYAAVYGVSLGEALRAVQGKAWAPRSRKPTGNDLRRIIEAWKTERWHRACTILHAARMILEHANPESDLCWQTIEHMARANDELSALETATPAQLLEWMVNADGDELRI